MKCKKTHPNIKINPVPYTPFKELFSIVKDRNHCKQIFLSRTFIVWLKVYWNGQEGDISREEVRS